MEINIRQDKYFLIFTFRQEKINIRKILYSVIYMVIVEYIGYCERIQEKMPI